MQKDTCEEGSTMMTDKLFENNQVTMMGEIVSAFQFSHEVFGEGFYMVELAVSRLSNYSDYIPLWSAFSAAAFVFRLP